MAGKALLNVKDNDLVEYFIYPNLSNCDGGKSILEYSQSLLESICVHVQNLSENYIWHKDNFKLIPSTFKSGIEDTNEPASFFGAVNYGENVEDEWFIVYLLIELTKKFNDLIVRVKDADGEFLLIEAAEELPNWVTPETCEDKVFLHQGCLHILPKSFRNKTLHDGLLYIRQNCDKTKASQSIQQIIDNRTKYFSTSSNNLLHRTTVFLPVNIAALLQAKPQLVSPAVRAFCERDAIDLKACRAMRYFPPETRVMTSIVFTRCLYAMLMSTKYNPDKRTGWNLPPTDDEFYKSHMLGIKLACGFEIILSQAKSNKSDDNLGNDQKWQTFLNSLESRNYFQGLLKGCEEHKRLLNTAKQFYTNCCEKFISLTPGDEIAQMVDNLDVDLDEFRRNESRLPESDDDSWLNITQADLDKLLEERFGRSVNNLTDKLNSTHIASHLNNFINNVSEIDGAEFPRIKLPGGSKPVRPKRGVKKKKKSVKFTPDTKSCVSNETAPASTTKVSFDPEGFMHAIQNILDFKIPDDNYWESEGSGMSSYEDEIDMDLGEPTNRRNIDNDLIQYMDEMDQELINTTMGQSFVKVNNNKSKATSSKYEDNFDDIETFKPVDIDLNALKNILSSYSSQMGEPGPAENLLGPMGVNLDDIDADVD